MSHLVFSVALYGRAGCCLCDETEEMLQSLRVEYAFTLHKIDIDEVPELRERWRCHIPVVTVDGAHRVALRVSEQRLRRAFSRAAIRRQS